MKTAHTSTAQKFSLESLPELSHSQLLDLFRTLPSPSIAEMDGEYAAGMLDQGSYLQNTVGHVALNNPAIGNWLTKSFQPLDSNYGRGYNSFDRLGITIRIYPMKTSIAASRFDDGSCFQLDYTAFDSLLGFINMVDEVRRLGPELYLGLGTWGFTESARQNAYPFVLSGPIRKFVGTDKAHREKPGKFTK